MRLAVDAGLGAGRDRLEEFGARGTAVDSYIVGKRGQRLQFGQPRAQLLDVLVAGQSGQRRGELVAGTLQFAAPPVGLPSRGHVTDLRRCQGRGQLLVRRSVLRLNLERGRAGRDASGHQAGNLNLGRGVRDGRPGLARRQRYPLVTDDQIDIGGGDEFDCRRDQSEPAFGPVDRRGGLLDLPEQIVRESDSRQLLRDLIPFALRGLDFR